METLIQPVTGLSANAFACPKCSKPFSSENALRMHTMRVHTRAGQQGAMWKKKVKTAEDKLNRQRDYNKKMRARYVAQGLTTRGEPRKALPLEDKNSKSREYNRNWYHKNKAKRKIQIVYPGPETRELSSVEKIENKIIERVAEKIFSTIWSAVN